MAPQPSIRSSFEASAGDPEGTRFPALRATLEGASKTGHVLLGEPHAQDMSLSTYRFLAANSDMFKTMARSGIKHLVLEFPNELEGKLDSYLEGKTDRAELRFGLFSDQNQRFDSSMWASNDEQREAFEDAILQTIDNARTAGMKIHFADVTSAKLFQTQQELLHANSSGAMTPDNVIREAAKMAWDRYDDSEQHTFLRDRIPMGDKILGCFGVAHISSVDVPLSGIQSLRGAPQGIAERLRNEEGLPVTTVGLWANQVQRENVSKRDRDGVVKGMTETDISAYFDTKEVQSSTKTPPVSPALPQKEPEFPSPGFGSK